jgi:hypothetical protein
VDRSLSLSLPQAAPSSHTDAQHFPEDSGGLPDVAEPRSIPSGFAQVPHTVARDTRLSVGARLLYVVLDGRAGRRGTCQVGQIVLAADLGVTDRTVRDLVAELVAAGLLDATRTRGTTIYRVHNMARDRKPSSAQIGSPVPVRPEAGFRSIEQQVFRNKQASNKGVAAQAVNTPAAAESIDPTPTGPDPFEVEVFLDGLPDRLRPEVTHRVATDLNRAFMTNGWTGKGLAAQVSRSITNPLATPALTVKVLRDLATRPADSY